MRADEFLGAATARRLIAAVIRAAYPARFADRFAAGLAQTVADDVAQRGRVRWLRLAAALLSVGIDGVAMRLRRDSQDRRGGLNMQAWLNGWRVDARSAWRSLWKHPGHSVAVILVLSIGVGAATAMFSVVDAVLLRPLPYPHGARLVRLVEREATRNLAGASFPAITEWSRFPSIAQVGAYDVMQLLFTYGDVSERADGVFVSPGFFDTLGSQPALGRVMQPAEPFLDPAPKIVLSHTLWQRQFHGDPDVIGRHLQMETRTFEVIGVMPPEFAFPSGALFWTTLPTNMKRVIDEQARTLRFMQVIARLADGATVDDVARHLQQWSTATAPLLPEADGRTWRAEAQSLHGEMVAPVRPALQVVMSGVVLLLLAACANVAALTLARGRARALNLALQSALGASRARLIRQQLVETALLALIGGIVAIAIAQLSRDGIIRLSIDQIPRISTIAIDVRAFAFALGCGLAAALMAAIGPAVRLTRRSTAQDVTQATVRIAGSRTGRRMLGAFVAAEFAFAVVLAAGAGLLLNSYVQLTRVRIGVDATRVGTVTLDIPLTPNWRGEAVRPLIRDMKAGIESLAGVTHAGFVSRLPLDRVRGGVDVQQRRGSGPAITTLYTTASEGYFSAVGTRLLAGRDFETGDNETAQSVAIINDVLAERLFGDPASAVGQTVTFQFMRGPVVAVVAGVVEAIRYDGLRSELRPELYQHYRQAIVPPGTVVFRSTEPPLTLAPGIRALLARLDPTATVTLNDWSTLEDRQARAVAQPRFFLVLVCVFAGAALLLACFGIYGTLSFWIAERRRELGIRVALGADRRRISRLVIGRGVSVAAIGIALGLGASLAGGRLISQMLFEVSAADPATLAGAGALLLILAVAVCAVPARRATRIDPIATLRD